jgi:uncharacterized protein
MPGVILFATGPGVTVEAGQEGAQIMDPTTGERVSLTVEVAGTVIGCAASRIAVPGAVITTITGSAPTSQADEGPFPKCCREPLTRPGITGQVP